MVLVCCDPFCALQAYFEGVKASSNFNIITLDHKQKLKNNTFVANTGHFDNEFDFAHTEASKARKSTTSSLRRSFSSPPLVTV